MARQPVIFKSTWRTDDRSKWNFSMRLIDWLNVHTFDLDKPVPVHAKTEKIPYVAQWSQHLWVLVHAFIPIVVQQLWLSISGSPTIGAWGIFLIYFNMYNIVAIREVHLLRHLGHKYGFLDGDVHTRDGVPDTGAGKVVSSLFKVTGARIALAIYFTYDSNITPLDAVSNWQWWAWLTLEIGLYCLVLDFWFYWYHRAMHDVDFLWDFHRTHHTTKHPNPLLTAYADHEQEFFDIVIIPLLTFASLKAMGLPFGFYEFWICQQYVVFTELWGHSGIRLHLTPPNTFSWFLQKLDAEIVIEDHDLHHRKGWRKSHSYGKQTRFWFVLCCVMKLLYYRANIFRYRDRVFGTCHARIESIPENIDYINQAYMPFF